MNRPQQQERWGGAANGGGSAALSGPAAVAAAAARARPARVMPSWVNAGGRSSAPPPPPPGSARPEPDYEVIEFPSEQYVNAKLNPAPRHPASQQCGLCGGGGARMRCGECDGRALCLSCDEMYHRHPKRRAHRRQPIGPSEDSDRPPLPPKGGAPAPPPVPPPRRNKVGGRSDSFSARGPRSQAPSPAPSPAAVRRPLPATPNSLPPHLKQLTQSNGSGPGPWIRLPTAASISSPPASPRPPHLTQHPQAWAGEGGGGGGGGGGWSGTLDRRRSAGGPSPVEGGLRRAPIASSVFELHRPDPFLHQQQIMEPQRFMPAQSMATLNCANCLGCQQQRAAGAEWWRYGSNMSLDARAHEGYPHPPPPGAGVWVNPWLPPPVPHMYPHTHQTMGRPSSRVHSRAVSRAGSPAASVRSRRSRHGRRYRETDDYSDDEDSSDERRPRRRDSLRSHTRATPSPVPNDHEYSRRGGRRESTSSYARRDSPVRVISKESPIRTIRDSPAQVQRETEPRVPLQRDVDTSRTQTLPRERSIPLSPTKNVRESPLRRTASSSEEQSQEPEPPPTEPVVEALEAPLPPVPTSRWQCEFCTYVNEAGVRVCEVCCRTPTAPPKSASVERSSPIPTQRFEKLVIGEPPTATPEKTRVTEPPKKGEDENTVNEKMAKSQEEEHASVGGSDMTSGSCGSLGVKRVKKKASCEKVSTGCGPSPPRESPPPPAPATGTASTGTSPLPQSISTQTYESPEELRQSTSTSMRPTSSTADESLSSTRRRSARSLRRDSRRSRRSPDHEHTSRSERSHSRHSFSSDRSIGTPGREWSPAPAPAPGDAWWREAGPLRSRSNSLMHPQPRSRAAAPRRPPPRRASHLDLYRESDPRWRAPDFGDPYAYPDLRDAVGSQPDVTRAVSLETLAAAAAARRHTDDVVRAQGMELVKLLREAESSGFTAEELHAATQLCEAGDPVRWLREHWGGMVRSVQAVASKLGREAGDCVGTLSEREARLALRRHKGSVWQAVTECVQQRQRKYGELMSRGKFSREEVLTCLTAHHGDLEAAYLDLTKSQLKPFLMKIWGPPEGVENESANPFPQPGTSAAAATSLQNSGDKIGEGVNLTYLDKLKKFETILTKDANAQQNDSVSENIFRFAENHPQVPSKNNAATSNESEENKESIEILAGLKNLLDRAGIPLSEQSLLSGIKNIMNIRDSNPESVSNSSKVNASNRKNVISSSIENDFIQAYNALTSSSPLPTVPNVDSIMSPSENLNENIAIAQNSVHHENKNVSRVQNVQTDRHLPEKTLDSNQLSINLTTNREVKLVNLTEKNSNSSSNNGKAKISYSIEENYDKNGDERNQHLSDIVNDTHRLVQQMKEEINSDIASYDETGNNSDIENESSKSTETSERDSYSDSESRSEIESSDEFTDERHSKDRHKTISVTSSRTTTSDENEQFEEAIDSIEIMSVEQSNMAALDAIVKSLQEIDSTMNSATKISEQNNTLEIIHVNEDASSSGTTVSIVPSKSSENLNSPSENVELSENNTEQTFNNPMAHHELVIKIETTEGVDHPPVFENQSSNALNNNSDFTRQENTEDYNNNSLTVKTFEELYESISLNRTNSNFSSTNESGSSRSFTPELIIAETLQLNQQTKNILPNNTISQEENSVQLDNQQEQYQNVIDNKLSKFETTDSDGNDDENSSHDNIKTSEVKDETLVITNAEEINGDKNYTNDSEEIMTSKTIELSNDQNVLETHNDSLHNVVNGNSKRSAKSSIPKLRTTNHKPSKSDIKSPTKVIVSKVPIRKNSLKQSTLPHSSQKSHFGNIQSGHVKKLQSSLFGKNDSKNPKIPVLVKNKTPAKFGLALIKPMPSKIITIQSDNSAELAKKKPYFQETCLSDDYSDTDDEIGRRDRSPRATSDEVEAPSSEPDHIPITSRIVNGNLVDFTQVSLKDGSPERQVRMLVAEGVVQTWRQGELAVALAARGEPPAAALLAAHDCEDLPSAIAYLRQDCELCAGHAPAYEMVVMLRCSHRCCAECARTYFTVQISERSIFDCVCPFCKLPELAAASAPPGDQDHEDEALEYFSQLEPLLRSVVAARVHELFQSKLRDRALLRDPNFKWCIECSSGFFVHPRQKRVKCPECRTVTCARCRKPWEKQHEGVSCEQFAEWKQSSDPETSLQAVQRHLQDNGIDCPKCKFRYSLARGGCMHFTCSQCKYEFCCGCGKPFTMGAQCGLSDYCAKLGLHAHHPRNCLFYMRDKEPHQLQTLLQMNNIEYKTEPADAAEDSTATGELAGSARRARRCPVALQRETPAGLVDTTCNGDAPPHHAGLCKNHYLEYLSRLVRRNNLDPISILQTDDLETVVRRAAHKLPPKPLHYLEYLAGVVMANGVDCLPIMDVSELVAELRRRALPLPERGPWDTDPIYAGMCAEIVREKIPLD